MNLLNHTLKYLALLLPVIIAVWAGLFYYNMVDEVEDSLDDGLENYKMLIIEQAMRDTTILTNHEFHERNYAIQPIDAPRALQMTDRYVDTLMYMINEGDFEPVRMLRTAFRQGDNYYQLHVISSSLEKDDLIEDLLVSIVWLYLVLLLSVLVINHLVLRKIWQPFHVVLDKIGRFHLEENPVISPTPTTVREFQELDDRLVRLAEQSAATYESQKQFLENAAHELQTPLAISINKLELLLDQDSMREQDLDAIGAVIRNLQRLTRLNKALLLLTRIENRQFADGYVVEVNELVTRIVEQFEDLAVSREVTIQRQDDGALRWIIHSDLAAILVTNLLKNALVHNRAGGWVRVSVTKKGMTIANTAVGSALDPQRIFDRFHKNAADNQRVGLGLAIVKAICHAAGLQIEYSFREGAHHFEVIGSAP